MTKGEDKDEENFPITRCQTLPKQIFLDAHFQKSPSHISPLNPPLRKGLKSLDTFNLFDLTQDMFVLRDFVVKFLCSTVCARSNITRQKVPRDPT